MTFSHSNAARLHNGRTLSSIDQPQAQACVDIQQMMPRFQQLVAETVAQVKACPAKPDATFDGYERLLVAIRSATTLEGTLLERGIALIAAINPDLTLVQLERPLPVHETAKAVFRRNDWAKASALRLDSEVATREFYRPDLLIVDGRRQVALVIDVKRSVASYSQRILNDLRSRMMASALVVRDVLERDHDVPPVARADIAIIDSAGDSREEAKAIFTLTDLDWMLRIEGAAAAIIHLRALYGVAIRQLLDERCKAVMLTRPGLQEHGNTDDDSAVDNAPEPSDMTTPAQAKRSMPDSQRQHRRIAVGIASRRAAH